MSGAKLPQHARNHRHGGSDPIPFPGLSYAYSGINGPYSVTSGGSPSFGIDDGDLVTNDAETFTVDEESGSPGIFGLGVHTAGTYVSFWTVNFQDRVGHRVTGPENYVAQAEDFSSSPNWSIDLPSLGSVFARGYTHLTAGFWDVAWESVFDVAEGGTTDLPIVIQTVSQTTGETLNAYTQLLCFKLSGGTTASIAGGAAEVDGGSP